MAQESFFKKELVKELRYVELLMKKDNDIEKKIYYFSAAYGITNRTLRYAFTPDYLLADLVLNSAYQGLVQRIGMLKSGDSTVQIEPAHFESIEQGLKDLADAFEKDTPILEPLETIFTASYSLSGPGNYLREKGMLKI